MKHTGKILFGVLSTSALVGTGFAAWIVNNGFTDTKTVVVNSSVDTDVENKYSSVVDLTVVETDNSLKFASVANGEDLTLVYNLKANEAAYTTDFSLVTNEYIPDVTVSLEVTSKAGLRADITTEVEKYLVLPETQTIPYDTWLKEDYKETGYSLNINFKWNTDDLGTNPQDWIETSEYNTPALQREYFTNLATTLSDAKFTFTFKIGRTVEMSTFSLDGEMLNGNLTFKDSNGNALTAGTSYRLGTEVEVVPNADPYYKVNKVLVNGEELDANLEGKYVFTLDKATTVSATFVNKVNTVTLNYEDTQGEVKLTNVLGEDLVGTTLNANDTFKVVATPNENYLLKDIVVTQGEETLTDVDGVYTVLDNEDGVNVTVTFEVKTATVTYAAVTGISNVKLNDIAISEVTTLDYGTEVTITFDVDEGYELTNVLLDGETLVATEEVYKFTVSKDTYTLSFEVGEVEETFDDINQALVAEKGTAVKVRGKVVADTASGPLVLDENGNYIYVYFPTGEYVINDLVKVEGTISNYSNRNQINNATIETFVDDTLVINDLETVGVTYEEISTNTAEFGLTEAKVSFDCRYDNKNFYIDGGETNYFQGNNLDTATLGLENGKYYNVEGYVSGYYNNSVSLTVSKVTVLETVTVTDFTLNEISSINVGQSLTLSIKDVKPTFYKDTVTPTFEVDENEYVRIEDNKLIADKAGEGLNIEIRAKVGDVTKSFFLTSVGKATQAGETVEKTYRYVFEKSTLELSGGSIGLGDLTWNYDAISYFGWDTNNDKGVQIGSSKKPQTDPWNLTTQLPEGVIVKSYSINLSVASSGNAYYTVTTGEYTSGEINFKNTSSQDYLGTIEGVNTGTDLTITLRSSADKAMYIKSMTFVFEVPTDVDFLPNV